jgi:hypothetical protein
VGGAKYLGLKDDDSNTYATKGATGVALAKTGTAVITGRWEQGQPGNAAKTVEKLADYLREQDA